MSFVWTLSSFKFKFNMIFKVNCSAVFNLETLLAAPGELVFKTAIVVVSGQAGFC